MHRHIFLLFIKCLLNYINFLEHTVDTKSGVESVLLIRI